MEIKKDMWGRGHRGVPPNTIRICSNRNIIFNRGVRDFFRNADFLDVEITDDLRLALKRSDSETSYKITRTKGTAPSISGRTFRFTTGVKPGESILVPVEYHCDGYVLSELPLDTYFPLSVAISEKGTWEIKYIQPTRNKPVNRKKRPKAVRINGHWQIER